MLSSTKLCICLGLSIFFNCCNCLFTVSSLGKDINECYGTWLIVLAKVTDDDVGTCFTISALALSTIPCYCH